MYAISCACLLFAMTIKAAPYTHDVKLAEEFRPRDGLPNFFAKLRAREPVRIAYLGGSITAASGWRPKTLAWFKTQYPDAQILEINAAISGTGSDYGACRLQVDVLAKHPVLVFLECRVNGGGGFEAQSVEGIIRQIWKNNPHTDICFVYTLGRWMLKELQAGTNTSFGQVMETVANAYGIPSIDLGVEIAKREKEGTLLFAGQKPVENKLLFSFDDAHPTDEGHDLYRDIIAHSMLQMRSIGTTQTHALPSPLEAANWETASLLPITNALLSAGWTTVDTSTDAVYTDDKERTHAMLRGAVRCNRAGETITVKWNGTTVGISDIPYGEPSGIIEAVIDGGEPVLMKRPQTEKSHKFARFWYLPEQKPGLHTVTFTTKENAPDSWFYAGQLLIVGTPVK